MSFNAVSAKAHLEKTEGPQNLLREIFTLYGTRAALGTSGQLTGTVMLDMALAAGVNPRVFTIDTLRLFPETYAFFDSLEKHYGLPIERAVPAQAELAEMLARHGEYLFFDSNELQEKCCFIRKVQPNQRLLSTLDVWITGLRNDQSAARAKTPRFEIISHEGRDLLKVAPLVDWTEERLRRYAEEKNVPLHPLLSKKFPGGYFYESLGCVLCATPISPTEPRRAGRWRWFNTADDKKECGLHLPSAGEKP